MKSLHEYFKKNKKLLSVLATIILGAFGSALWELALSPLFSCISKIIIEILGYFSDSVYSSVPDSGHSLLDFASFLFIFIVALSLNAGPHRFFKVFDYISQKSRIWPHALYFSMLILFCYQMSLDNLHQTAIKEIEIISPYISENEYKQLKSDFYSIKNKNDYDSLLQEIQRIADENSIDLKK